MKSYSVKPYQGKAVSLDLRLPGSKSLTNRSLILAALSEGETRMSNFLFSEDTHYLSEVLRALGLTVKTDEVKKTAVVVGGKLPSGSGKFLVGNAGTAMRFLTSYLCLGKGDFILDGNERMRQRPIADLLKALEMLDCDIKSEAGNGCPPVKIHADGIKGFSCDIFSENSSQYVSSLLMSAPCSKNGYTIHTQGDVASRPYIEMTLGFMKKFGAVVPANDYKSFHVPSSGYKTPGSLEIEPDASSASYFLAGTALLGGKIIIRGLGKASLQGDTEFALILEKMGCRCEMTTDTITIESDGKIKGLDVDMNSCPDVVPTLAVLAMFASGPTRIRNVANLRIKECDRISALATEIKKMGGNVKEFDEGLEIFPENSYNHALIFTYNDHRIAMSFALAGLKVDGVVIENPDCVAKSFPDYFDTFEKCFNN